MPRRLSKRESIVLRVIGDSGRHWGADGSDLVSGVREALGSIGVNDVPLAGVHRTAASLIRKDLAWRAESRPAVVYKITETGRRALAGDVTGKWVTRG